MIALAPGMMGITGGGSLTFHLASRGKIHPKPELNSLHMSNAPMQACRSTWGCPISAVGGNLCSGSSLEAALGMHG